MRRRLPSVELLEQRHLMAADSYKPQILPFSGPSANTQILFQSDESGAGMYVPAIVHDERLAELSASHLLRTPRFGFGRLSDVMPADQHLKSSGAAPNLRVTNTQILRDGNGGFVDSIPVGQMVVMQVNFSSEGITAGSPFTIRFDMDGVPIDYVADWVTGDGNWFVWWSGWYASPALHNLSITLDVSNRIAETNESDNTGSQAFTPYQATTLPEKLIFPSAGIRNRDFAVNNYADVDPRSGQQRDYRDGVFQYDNHNAWDFGPMNFLGQDQGLPILAAAAGVVAEVADGHFDRKTDWANTNANYVIIDHGNSWRTIYWHLARDSVTVQVGQVVAAGAVIGEMGSSGISTGTHLHFSLYRNGFPVESMYDLDTYYRESADVAYQLDTPTGGLIGNISNYNSPADTDWRESFPSKRVFTRTANDPVVLNFGLSHLNVGETITIRLRRPDGSIRGSSNWTASSINRFPQFYWWYGAGAWKEQVGTWRWEVEKAGQVLLNEAFQVTDGVSPPQIRVRDWVQQNVNPGRTTPLDFGITLGTRRPFSITNHGDSPLLLGAPVFPAGFSLIGGFPQNIAAGATSSFTLQFDNAFHSASFGSIRFTTNDPELPEFWFNVEGRHIGAAADVASLNFLGPDLAYELGAAPRIIDSNATYQPTAAQADVLKVSLNGAVESGDVVAIRHQGFETGQVGVSGVDVSYGGVIVGTIQLGLTLPDLLQVKFNAEVTPGAVTAILRSLEFSSTTENALPRFLRANVVNLTGVSSTHAYKGIRVHEPVIVLNLPVTLARNNAEVTGNVQSALINTGTWSDPEGSNANVVLTASIGTVVKNANGTWSWSHVPTVYQNNEPVTITANDGLNSSSVTFNLTANTFAAGRSVFYNNATGANLSSAGAANDAIDTSKSVLRTPGATSTFANYTNYARGLNGLIVDIAGLPITVTNAQMLASLQFAHWDAISAGGFAALPVAAVPTVTILSNSGVGGSARIKITFPDDTLRNTWLRVTVVANTTTGLATNDEFYFGNVIGDFGVGNTATRLRVNATDTGAVRSNQTTAANSASVTNIYDVNRDGRVNATDTGIVRSNQQTAGIVAPLTIPAGAPPAAATPEGEGAGKGNGSGSDNHESNGGVLSLGQEVLSAQAALLSTFESKSSDSASVISPDRTKPNSGTPLGEMNLPLVGLVDTISRGASIKLDQTQPAALVSMNSANKTKPTKELKIRLNDDFFSSFDR